MGRSLRRTGEVSQCQPRRNSGMSQYITAPVTIATRARNPQRIASARPGFSDGGRMIWGGLGISPELRDGCGVRTPDDVAGVSGRFGLAPAARMAVADGRA